ncbi:MAG TPA: hypothetical protein ENI23_14410 [bacterium]|nr:hypothetical protein [bacterium]
MKKIHLLGAVLVLVASFAVFINQDRIGILGMKTGPADSAWPTFHGNNQRTGLSPYDTSHVDGTVLWTFEAGGGIEASPTIGEDGTIYFGAMDGYVYAVNKDGTLKWKTKIGTPQIKGYGGDSHLSSVTSTPAIDKDGNIYVTSRDQYIFALNSEGEIKWKFQINLTPDHWGSALIGDDGTIYINASPPDENFYPVDETIYIRDNPPKGGLYALNPDGTLKWHYTVDFRMFNSPTMDKEGTIYIAVLTDYYENKLIAFNPDGTVKWEVLLPQPVESSPTAGDNGVIYLGSFDQAGKVAGLFAVTEEGILWHHVVGGKEVLSTPAIAPDGTIHIGSMTSKVFAINPDGTRKWEFDTGGSTVESSTAIGADGTLYFGVNPGGPDKPIFFALNPDGTVKWKFAIEMHTGIMATPAIGSDGTVYITTMDGNLYAFGEPEKESTEESTASDPEQNIQQEVSEKPLPLLPFVVGGLVVVGATIGVVIVIKKRSR